MSFPGFIYLALARSIEQDKRGSCTCVQYSISTTSIPELKGRRIYSVIQKSFSLVVKKSVCPNEKLRYWLTLPPSSLDLFQYGSWKKIMTEKMFVVIYFMILIIRATLYTPPYKYNY